MVPASLSPSFLIVSSAVRFWSPILYSHFHVPTGSALSAAFAKLLTPSTNAIERIAFMNCLRKVGKGRNPTQAGKVRYPVAQCANGYGNSDCARCGSFSRSRCLVQRGSRACRLPLIDSGTNASMRTKHPMALGLTLTDCGALDPVEGSRQAIALLQKS